MRIAGRTFVVLLLASLPGLGLLLWAAIREREQARDESVRTTTAVVEMLAREQEHVFASAHLLLTVMSDVGEVVGAAPSCSATLARMIGRDPRLVALGVVNTAGDVICTSFEPLRGRHVGGQTWFTRVISTRAFAVGDYQRGQITGRPLVIVGLPAMDGDSVTALLFAALDVQTLIDVTERVPLPHGATVTVFDRAGTLLGRQPPMPTLIGRRAMEPAFRTKGSFEGVGLDGVRRIYSSASLPSAPQAGVTVAVGVPTQSTYSRARNLLWQAALAAAFALIVALAFGRRRAIMDREREAEGRARRERFFESLIENAFDSVFILDGEGTFTYASPTVELSTGYRPEEFIGRKVFEFNASTGMAREERFRAILETPGAVLRTRYTHASGLVRDAEIISKNMLADPAIGGVVVNFRDITDRVRAEEELLSSRDQLRTLAHGIVARVEQERRRIAREIHDDLGQSITSLNLDVGWLQKRLRSDAPAEQERLRAMEEQLTATAQTVRDIAQELHAGYTESMRLGEAIHTHVRQFGERSGLAVVMQLDDVEDDIPADISIALFRITQEATTNIARHAGATRVRVILNRTDEGLRLEIHDNGRGLEHQSGQHVAGLGVLSMRERCLALGGSFEIGSSPDGGVKISVEVPL